MFQAEASPAWVHMELPKTPSVQVIAFRVPARTLTPVCEAPLVKRFTWTASLWER